MASTTSHTNHCSTHLRAIIHMAMMLSAVLSASQ